MKATGIVRRILEELLFQRRFGVHYGLKKELRLKFLQIKRGK